MKRPPGRVIKPEHSEGFQSLDQTILDDTSFLPSTNSDRRLGMPTKGNLLWLIGYLVVTAPRPSSAIPVPSSTLTVLNIEHRSSSPAPPTPSVSFPSYLSLPTSRPSADLKGKTNSILGPPSPAISDNDCDQANSCSMLSTSLPSSSPSPPPSSSLTSSQMVVPRQLINRSLRARSIAIADQGRVVDRYLSDDTGTWSLNLEWELYGIHPINAAATTSSSSGSATSTSTSADSSIITPTRLPPGWGTTSRSEFELPLIVACSVALALVVLVTMFTFIRRRNKHRRRPKKGRSKGKKADPLEGSHPKPASTTSSVASIRSQQTKERSKGKRNFVGILRPKGTKGFLRLRKRRSSPGSDEDDEDGAEDGVNHVWANRTRPDGGSEAGGTREGEEGTTDRVGTSNEETLPSRVASYSSLDPLSSLTSTLNSANPTDHSTATTTTTTTASMPSIRETPTTSLESATNRIEEQTPAVHHENISSPASLMDPNRDLSLPETPESHQLTPPAYRASQVTSSVYQQQQHRRHLDDPSLSQPLITSEHPPMPYSSSQAQHPDRLHQPAPPFTPGLLSAGSDLSGRPRGTAVDTARAESEGAIVSTMGSDSSQPSTTIIDASDYPRDEKFRPARPVTPPFPSSSTSHTNHLFSGRLTEASAGITTTTNMAHHLATDDKGVLARLANQASAPVDLDGAPSTEGHESDQLEGSAPPGWDFENAPSTLTSSSPAPFASSSLSPSSAFFPINRPGPSQPGTMSAGEGTNTGFLPAPPRQWGTKTMEDPYIPLDASEISLGPPDGSMEFVTGDENGRTDGLRDLPSAPSAPFDPQSELTEPTGYFEEEDQEAEAPSAPPLGMEEEEEEEPDQGQTRESFEASAPNLQALEEDDNAPHLESEAQDGDH